MAISIPHRAERTLHRPRRRIVVMVAIGSVAVAGLFVGSRSSLFDARTVEVTGASHIARPELLRVAGVGEGTNVLWLDELAVEGRLEIEPWVATAEVSTSLPWTIRIEVAERSPVAVTGDGHDRSLVSGDGTILGSVGGIPGLPRIDVPVAPALDGPRPSVAGAASALDAMTASLRARVERVVVSPAGTLELRLEGGVVVRYGSATSQRRKAAVIERILAWPRSREGALTQISVVAPSVPAVVLAE